VATQIVQELQRAIDIKHKEALGALKTLQAYLEESPLPITAKKAKKSAKKAKNSPPSRAGTGKIRPAVLAEFAKDFLAIKMVAEQTGFTTLQVRGVVMAPGLKDRFAKKEIGDVMHYKYEAKSGD